MAEYHDREAFIPYRRADLIDMCIEDGRLAETDVPKFREFCQILAAYYHFELHQLLEELKDNFVPFNPDADTKTIVEPTPQEITAKEAKLVESFEMVLKRANYNRLSQIDLERAFNEASLVDLKTDVDFDDFDRIIFYHRGDVFQTTTIKKFFRQVEIEVDIFERVVLLLKFKDQAHFKTKKIKIEELDFTPGKTYIYLYKNIPRYDLELLFPNVKVSMTWKDRLLFGVPAIGAAVPVLIKALPQLLLIVGVILFFTVGPSVALNLGANQETVNNIMPALVALLSVVVALGGFAFKQFNSYKNKRMKFLKDVTDTLFFRMLDSNAGVFNALIDAAEEEETKEIILVYYHLLTHPKPLTQTELDDKIEAWMEEKFGMKIDFDINGPLRNLEQIQGKVKEGGPTIPLLRRDKDGTLHLLSLDESKKVIDYMWDNLFRYDDGLKPENVKKGGLASSLKRLTSLLPTLRST